jgi:hypothetical protein
MYYFSWWHLAFICVMNMMKCIHTRLHFRRCVDQCADSCISCNLSGEMLAISYSQTEIPYRGTPPVKSKLQGRIVHRQGDSRQHDDMLLCKMKHPLKNVFKVTCYVSVKHNHSFLLVFKYSYMFGSVKTIIRTSLQYFEGKGKIHYNCIHSIGSHCFTIFVTI